MHDAQNAIYPYIVARSDDRLLLAYQCGQTARAHARHQRQSQRYRRGAQPFEAIDQLIKDWRANGGEQSRMEFQQAMS